MDMNGELEYGVTETLGFAAGGVELVKDAHYEEIVPEDIRATVEDLEAKITSGEIEVKSALTMTADEVTELKASVAVQ